MKKRPRFCLFPCLFMCMLPHKSEPNLNFWVGAFMHPPEEHGFSGRAVWLKGELLGIHVTCCMMKRHKAALLVTSSFDHYSIVAGQQRVNYKSNSCSLIHTRQFIEGPRKLKRMGSLLALRGSRVGSRQSRKKWPVPSVHTGPVGWTDWHQIACVLLHSLPCPCMQMWGEVCVCTEIVHGRQML